jgi:dihydrolipoamide dehydrogenase
LVVGGGYIGLELGTVYAALGSRVTVVEVEGRVLPGADKELVRVLQKALESRFEAILTGTRVVGLREDADGLLATFAAAAGGEADQADDSAAQPEREERFDRVLVAVGRRPNSSGLGLSTTRVGVDKRGFIEVDASGRTADAGIYAIGDVVGEPMLAHKATHQGLIAAEALTGQAAVFEPNVIPAVVFTDPELAWCGMSEEQAREAGLEVSAARFPWQASGRAKCLGNDSGLTKLVVDTASERVVGAGVVGPGAGEMIIEAALAIEMGALASDLAATVHPHPTLSETWMEAAEVFYGQSVHLYRRRRERAEK